MDSFFALLIWCTLTPYIGNKFENNDVERKYQFCLQLYFACQLHVLADVPSFMTYMSNIVYKAALAMLVCHVPFARTINSSCGMMNAEFAELKKIDMEGSGSLDGSSEDAFGPLAVILVGYQIDEFEAFRKCMLDMDADMVKVRPSFTTAGLLVVDNIDY